MDPDITELYHGPLDDFVARRNTLSKKLRPTDADAAATVAKLRKPPISAWAINQVAAHDAGIVADLLAAGADASEAQQAVADGSGSGAYLRATVARVREAVDDASRAAESALAEAGHPGGDETLRRIRVTLQAAATGGPEARVSLWQGTLDGNVSPAGFGGGAEPDRDPPELAKALAPLRRRPPPVGQPRLHVVQPTKATPAADREADRLEAAARKAQATAATKRDQADRLADAARAAEADAIEAELAAAAAEEALAQHRGEG